MFASRQSAIKHRIYLSCISIPPAKQQQLQTIRETSTESNNSEISIKPFSEIPGRHGIDILRKFVNIPRSVRVAKGNKYTMEGFSRFGPIYKSFTPMFNVIRISDVNVVAEMFRTEGKYPTRGFIYDLWNHWKTSNNLPKGLLTIDGEDWKRIRLQFDKFLMKPKTVAAFTDEFNAVITDFVSKLQNLRDPVTKNIVIDDWGYELHYWSLESIASALYDIRIGSLSASQTAETKRFVRATHDVVTTSSTLVYLPIKWNMIFLRKSQKLHDQSWEIIYKLSQQWIDEKIVQLKNRLNNGEKVTGVLATLLSSDLSPEEIYSNLSDLLMAATDTSSATIQWCCYLLARNPEVQERLHEEVISVVPRGKLPTYQDIQNLPLVRGCIKEALRMYPATNILRLTTQDTVLSGYRIPAGTYLVANLYAMGRDPKIYSEPNSFKPERWIRSTDREQTHTFGWIPFGFGPRACIGRRVAELQMHLLLTRLSQLYVMTHPETKEVQAKMGFVLFPERPIKMQFQSRSY